jgi:hypothetical protein
MTTLFHTSALAIALGICTQANSQYFEKDTIPSSMMKHVFFADITPVIAFAIQASDFDPVYALGYKRQLSPAKRLRLQLQFRQKDESSGYASVGVNDSLSLWYKSDNSMNEVQLRAGMEWGNFERKVAPFYAVDFIAGHKKDENSRALYLGSILENTYQLSETEADTLVLNLPRLNTGSPHDQLGYTTKSLQLGFALTFGLRVEMAPRWESWIQMSPEIVYTHAYEAIDTEKGVSIGTSGNSSLDFRFKLLNFGLGYKF